MGHYERRYWDDREYSSREVRDHDDPGLTFAVFVPHQLGGWRAELDRGPIYRT